MIDAKEATRELKLALGQITTQKVITGLEIAQNQLDIHACAPLWVDALLINLTAYIYKEDLKTIKKEEVVRWPATWQDAFKLQYFPEWLLRKFPVKYKHKLVTLTAVAEAYYPQLPQFLGQAKDLKPFLVLRQVIPYQDLEDDLNN